MFAFSFSVSNGWALALFAALSALLAIYTYRASLLSLPLKIFLASLRGVAVFLTCALLLDPALSSVEKRIDPPTLALAIDDSESLTIKDNAIARDSVLRELLSKNRDNFTSLGKPLIFSFGKTCRETSLDSLAFKDKETNISDALQSLSRLKDTKKFNAVLLFSDGQFTAGENPIYAADVSLLPIYTVMLGDTVSKRDIVARRVVAPEVAVVGTKVPVSVVISQTGFRGSRVEVTLRDGADILERKLLDLTDLEQRVAFDLTPKAVGEAKYLVSVSTLDGEFSTRNNALAFFINVQKQKKKILVITGLPDPEISAVKNALLSNPSLNAIFFTQRSPTEFFEGAFSAEAHRDADACMLVGFPNTPASESLSQQVLSFLSGTNIPVLSLLTFQSSATRLKQYDALLAVKVGRTQGEVLDNLAFIALGSAGAQFAAFRPMSAMLDNTLKLAPPVSYLDCDFQPKPTASVLWRLRVGNRVTEKLLFAAAKLPARKAATITAIQLWHLSLSPDNDVRDFYRQTLLGTLDWLVADEDTRRFKVEPTSKLFDESSRISFNATLQDELLRPISSARISLKVREKKSGQEFSTEFEAGTEAGLYAASFERLPSGDYAFSAEAREADRSLGTASGAFSISETSTEFRLTEANPDVMREIARRSGGKFYTEKDFAHFFDDIKRDAAFQPTEMSATNRIELANVSVMLIAIIALLAAEWLIRKLNALP